ncbi:glycoside hydrolase [Lipomyces chichibuensis]|uniref:glycoside hydrolase n=1 Tax=Lipomyces chichibuensis TaxID=1546026 RepID=UPI003343F51B
MSFSVQQNAPDFSSSARSVEEYLWTARGAGFSGTSAGRHRGNDSDLPLYKDKPLHQSFSQRSKRARSIWITTGIAFGVIVYMLYRILSSAKDAGKPSWFFGSTGRRGKIWKDRQNQVKEAFLESWNGYEKYAFGKDIYRPVAKTSRNMAPEGMGWIIVDCLDTMMIMNLEEPLQHAREWVANNLTYDQDYEVNTFETTIRMLGGLLSAHYLSGYDDMYLEKAVDLANRLLPAFDSATGIPYASVNLQTGKGVPSHDDGGASSTAEATSLQLEFKYVSKLTGEALYWEKAERVIEVIDSGKAVDGLVPIFIMPETGGFRGDQIRLGSRGDSYYEYLLKQYLQTNSKEDIYRMMYDESMAGVKKRLMQKSMPSGLTYVAELDHGIDGALSPKMDHLVCFLPGNLALGSTGGYPLHIAQRTSWTITQASDMKLAKDLARTCYEMYRVTKTGIAPEIVYFNTDPKGTEDISIKWQDSHNLQRPETVESLFILWRITKDPIYREWGWEIFEAFRKYARLVDGTGYTCLESVNEVPPRPRDNMESFWMAETLKYLYLLFEDDDSILPLENVVFNTEAHPMPKFNMEPLFKTGWARSSSQPAHVVGAQ